MNLLGNGLYDADHYEDALTVQEAELSMRRRIGAVEQNILVAQGNLANTYGELGHMEKALSMERDIYSGYLKLNGEEHRFTITSAMNYAISLLHLRRFEEARSLLRKLNPVAQRVLGEANDLTLKMRWNYANALYKDPDATLDEVREAVSTLEDTERTARRVLGGAHPHTVDMEQSLRKARAALRARETPATE